MDITLQSIQFALFFQNRNLNTFNIFNDSLRTIFNGNPSIESLPEDSVFDDIPSLRILSANEEKVLQGTRKRLDYFFNKEVQSTTEALVPHFEEVKQDVQLIRQNVPANVGISRIGYILNFKFVSTEPIDTSILIAAGLADAVSGDFDNSSVRLVKKSVFSGLNSNNVISLNLKDNKVELVCQRDFNTVANEDYTTELDATRILAYIEEVADQINLEEISALFED